MQRSFQEAPCLSDATFAEAAIVHRNQPDIVSNFGTVGQILSAGHDSPASWLLTAGHCVEFDANSQAQPLPVSFLRKLNSQSFITTLN